MLKFYTKLILIQQKLILNKKYKNKKLTLLMRWKRLIVTCYIDLLAKWSLTKSKAIK